MDEQNSSTFSVEWDLEGMLGACLTTDQVAAELGVKPGKLRAFLARYGVTVPKFGGTLVFPPALVAQIREKWDRIAGDCCPHCGKPLKGPGIAQDASGGSGDSG